MKSEQIILLGAAEMSNKNSFYLIIIFPTVKAEGSFKNKFF
jgi:hypothetical protein